MHDVAWHHEVNCVRSKDAQKQLARTSLKYSSSVKMQSWRKAARNAMQRAISLGCLMAVGKVVLGGLCLLGHK